MKVIFILIISLFSNHCFATKFYSWVDENGVKHYSAKKPEETENKANYKEKEFKDSVAKKSTSDSTSFKSDTKSYKNQENCEPEPEKGWDAATLRNIRGYYNTRTKQCKQFYKAGSSQIKNCFQEQKEIKEKKMKEHRKRMQKRCR